MPFVIVFAVAVALAAFFVILIPLSLVIRYRVATSRRRHRGWVVATNAFSFGISATLLVGTAMVVSLWRPETLDFVVVGLGVGALLGMLGLALARWEEEPTGLFVTANRWLVLLVSCVVAGRIALGIWRALTAWPGGDGATVAATVLAGSMAAGGVLVGYSLAFWLGVRARIRRVARLQRDGGP